MNKPIQSIIIITILLSLTVSVTAFTHDPVSDARTQHPSPIVRQGDDAIAFMAFDESQQHDQGIYTFNTANPHELTMLSDWYPEFGFIGGTYDLNGNLYMVDASATSSTLYLINQTTWTGTAIGTTGYPMHAMTCDPTTGIIYCAGGQMYYAINLYTIDPETGVATPVGTFGTDIQGVFDLAIDSTGQMYAIDVYTDSLYTVDKDTGVATLVGPTGYNMNFEQDMCWDANAQALYTVSFIWGENSVFCSVDRTTGAVTILGIFGFPQLDALCFPLVIHHEDFPPQTDIALSGQGGPDTFTSDVTVTLTAVDDDDTGVNATFYKVDTEAWKVYTTPFTVSGNGPHQIQYYSDDTAVPPNVEDVKVATFSIQYPLDISIKGGLGITAVINSPGTGQVALTGSFTVTGLVFPKTKTITGTIDDGTDFITKMMIFGIGPTTITVKVNGFTANATGFVAGIFLLGVK
jgi:hypothetical protein